MGSGTGKFITLSAVLLGFWLGGKYLLPLCFPFLLGLALALAAEPMVRLLTRRLGFPRAAASGVAVSLVFLFLVLIIILLCALLLRELGMLAGILPDMEQTAADSFRTAEQWLLTLSSHTPESIRSALSMSISNMFSDGSALLSRAGNYAMNLAGTVLSHIPDSVLSLGTGVISGYMISYKLTVLRRWILRRFPREKLERLGQTWKQMKATVLRFLTAQFQLSSVTFGILLLGFLVLGIPYAPVWALAVALVDAFPVLGTGTILLPWALLSLVQSKGVMAAGILGIYAAVSVIRSVLEPKLLGKHLGLDPLVTLIALYAGYKLWGLVGMILSPLLAVTAVQLVTQRSS